MPQVELSEWIRKGMPASFVSYIQLICRRPWTRKSMQRLIIELGTSLPSMERAEAIICIYYLKDLHKYLTEVYPWYGELPMPLSNHHRREKGRVYPKARRIKEISPPSNHRVIYPRLPRFHPSQPLTRALRQSRSRPRTTETEDFQFVTT